MKHSSLPLGQYLQFKIFEFFRDHFWPLILPYTPESKLSISHPFDIEVSTILKHLFIAPEELSRKKSFNLTGAESPFICFWVTSPLEWNIAHGGYGNSVLPRDFEYLVEDPDNPGTQIKKNSRGFLQDYRFSFEIFSSSYYRDFRDKLNFNLMELDRIRMIPLSLVELMPGFKTHAELLLKGIKFKDVAQTNKTARAFSLSASYETSLTLVIRFGSGGSGGFGGSGISGDLGNSGDSEDSLGAINLYLNDSKIWSSLT